jgi:hypothetical protein
MVASFPEGKGMNSKHLLPSNVILDQLVTNYVLPWFRVFPEKLLVTQLVIKFFTLNENYAT